MGAVMGMRLQTGTFGTTGVEMWQPGGACENGRLLMVTITVVMFQNGAFGSTGPEM